MSGPYSHATTPLEGTLPVKVPSIGLPQLSRRLAHSCMLATNAAINITGMFDVYKNFNGHLIPCPLILPNDNGISTFIDCAYTAIANTKIVESKADIIISAVVTSPLTRLWKNAGTAPDEYVTPARPLGPGSQLNACMKRLLLTPAAINRLIPLPNPHLLTTSSKNMIRS